MANFTGFGMFLKLYVFLRLLPPLLTMLSGKMSLEFTWLLWKPLALMVCFQLCVIYFLSGTFILLSLTSPMILFSFKSYPWSVLYEGISIYYFVYHSDQRGAISL